MTDARRDLPSVSSLLEMPEIRALIGEHPRRVVVDAVREAIEAARTDARSLRTGSSWADEVRMAVRNSTRPSLRKVFNASGVILHTNLGRAPLAEAAIDAMRVVAEGYSNLEYNLESGARGSRYAHCVSLLQQLTGAEDALVVNNCAAALVLALNALAYKKEVLVSRGELVEIGGSFRIPDIMARSAAKLVEVGTTNRTHDDDYRRAISPRTGAIVKVHRSNFTIEGFTAEVTVDRLSFIAREHGLPVIHDLGSGLLISLEEYGLLGEPTASEVLTAGASVVTMSGDKLLGGPQAGIILGSAAVISRLRKNAFLRAMRVDKLTLSALEATLRLYLDPVRACEEIPVLAMVSAPASAVETRARALASKLGAARISADVIGTTASIGGGAFPAAAIASFAVAVSKDVERAEKALRGGEPAVIARIENSRLLLDLRTVLPREDAAFTGAVIAALS